MRSQTRTDRLFEAWYAAERNTPRVAAQEKIPERTLRQYVQDLGWHELADARDHEATLRAERQAIDRRVKLLEEQRQAGELLRRRGVEYLAKNAIDNSADAIRAIDKGVALERSAADFANARVEVTGKDGGPILVADVGSARMELGEAIARFADALGADAAHRDALPADDDDPPV